MNHFQFNSTDRKNIENEVNIKNGVIEFTDCNNIKFPINVDEFKIPLEK